MYQVDLSKLDSIIASVKAIGRHDAILDSIKGDLSQLETDTRRLLDFMAGVKMLQTLALGGGLLSLLNLFILLFSLLLPIIKTFTADGPP